MKKTKSLLSDVLDSTALKICSGVLMLMIPVLVSYYARSKHEVKKNSTDHYSLFSKENNMKEDDMNDLLCELGVQPITHQ